MDDRRGRDDPAMILSGGKNVYTNTTRSNERASMNTGASSGGFARLRRFAYWLDVIGLDPLLGDIFDFAWKANLRNVALLERHLAAPDRAERADRSFVLLVICGVAVMALGVLALGILLTRWAFRALGGA